MKTSVKSSVAASAVGLVLLSAGWASAAPRTHDGFYLGLEGGFGYLSSSVSYNGADMGKWSGMTMDTAIWLGGTVGPVVIGGGMSYANAFSPKFSQGGQSTSYTDLSLALIAFGPFVDIYPNPNEGLHFMGFAGWGGLNASYQGNSGGSDPTGLVAMLGGGYEFWVADQWSIGPLGRFTYAPLSLNDMSYSTIAFTVLADFKYH